MALTKKDKSEVKDIARGEIRGIVKREIIDAISEVIMPAFDQVYAAIGKVHRELKDFEIKTESNFSDIRRQINDLKLDTPSNRKFLAHEDRIHKLEYELCFV